MLPCPFAMHKDVSVLDYGACLDCQPSGAGMLLGLVKSTLTDPLACPRCHRPIDYGNGMLHAGGQCWRGFLPVENEVQKRWGPLTPAKGHPMTAWETYSTASRR